MKIKNIFFPGLVLIAGFLSASSAPAAWVGQAEAETLALRWVGRQWPDRLPMPEIMSVMPEKAGGPAAFYIVNILGGGFVLVSGNDLAYPILAYSQSGKIDESGINPAFSAIIASYKTQIESAARSLIRDGGGTGIVG